MTENLRKWWLSGCLFTLYAIYPIPHTIALRNLILVICLASSLWIIRQDGAGNAGWRALRHFRVSGWILAVLTVWLLIQSSLISPYPQLALNLWRGDWLIALLVALTAGFSVLAGRTPGAQSSMTALVFGLFAHALLLVGFQCWLFATQGTFPMGLTPFANRDYHSTLLTTLIALLLAELLARTHNSVSLKISSRMLLAMLALSYVATWTLMARNGVIVAVAMTLAASGWLLVKQKRGPSKRLVFSMLTLILALGFVTWIGQRNDERWNGFGEAAQAALDTEKNFAWLNELEHPLPLMQNGQEVGHSTYMRIAWAKVALQQIQKHPFGMGYGHKAFGWAVNLAYNVQSGLESSHSGLLDFTLANGIPGLLLWLALSGALLLSGWRAFRKTDSAYGLMLVFTVAAYLVRCTIDGHLSGFRLEMYALLVGALVMAQSLESERCK